MVLKGKLGLFTKVGRQAGRQAGRLVVRAGRHVVWAGR